MKFKILLAIVVSCFAIVGSGAHAEITMKDKHKQMGMTCDTCHGQTRPREVPDEAVCLKCHGSRDKVKQLTSKLNPNPHFGHDDSIACNDCHKEHEKSVLTCDQCHKFGYKTP